MNQKVTSITQKVILPASPQEVYEAYTDPAKQSEFTGSKATGKPKVGGKYTAWDGYAYGKYLELEPGKRIVQEWITTDWEEGYGPSKLELTLKPAKEGTELVLIQSNVPVGRDQEFLDGWTEFYWDPLKVYLKKKR
jgi:uncharacterized protein YndB with AHSA1/START domain